MRNTHGFITKGIFMCWLAFALIAPGGWVSQAHQAKLTITDAGSGKYRLQVHGLGPANAEVWIAVNGDDEFFDDLLFAFENGHSLPDGAFVTSKIVSGSSLNEDWGRDEIYAIAHVGSSAIRTNTIRRSF